MKKEVPAFVLFIIAVVSYGFSYIIGGVFGSGFGVLGLICLLLSVVGFFKEQSNKKNKTSDYKLDQLNCKYCDNKSPSDAKFCNKCGKPIEIEKKI